MKNRVKSAVIYKRITSTLFLRFTLILFSFSGIIAYIDIYLSTIHCRDIDLGKCLECVLRSHGFPIKIKFSLDRPWKWIAIISAIHSSEVLDASRIHKICIKECLAASACRESV